MAVSTPERLGIDRRGHCDAIFPLAGLNDTARSSNCGEPTTLSHGFGGENPSRGSGQVVKYTELPCMKTIGTNWLALYGATRWFTSLNGVHPAITTEPSPEAG